jgi:DNA-directed RNA polymerase subunit L
MNDIPTYTVLPESNKFNKNTTFWDPELLTHQLVYLPMIPDFLDTTDLNMLELNLKVNNEEKEYRHVFSRELTLINKEISKMIPIDKVLLYQDIPLFLIGPKQEVDISCKIEKKTKRESDSRHQSAMAGIHYTTEDEIFFTINIQTGIKPKELVLMTFEKLIKRLQSLQLSIKSKDDKFHVQRNRYGRYDIVFLGEDHSLGALIEKWNNKHDTSSLTGYRQTGDGITFDYGVSRLQESKDSEKETLGVFSENLNRIEKYINDLKNKWRSVKVENIPIPKYLEMIESQRLERLER